MRRSTGLYSFSIRADDTGWITIDGKTVVADAGNVSHEQGDGTIELSAGTHRIIVGERNIAGDSSAHSIWQIPGGDARDRAERGADSRPLRSPPRLALARQQAGARHLAPLTLVHRLRRLG